MIELTKEQFEYWKSLPETQAVFDILHAELNELRDFVTTGGTINVDSPDKTAMETAGYLGRIRGLESILRIEFEEERKE